jgi:hypothetical protein
MAQKLTPAVREWLGPITRFSDEDIQKSLFNILSNQKRFNAFQMGQALADDFWPVDGQLIGILQTANDTYRTTLNECVVDWVMQHGVRLNLRKDDMIHFEHLGNLAECGRVEMYDTVTARAFTAFTSRTGEAHFGVPIGYEKITAVFRQGVLMFRKSNNYHGDWRD